MLRSVAMKMIFFFFDFFYVAVLSDLLQEFFSLSSCYSLFHIRVRKKVAGSDTDPTPAPVSCRQGTSPKMGDPCNVEYYQLTDIINFLSNWNRTRDKQIGTERLTLMQTNDTGSVGIGTLTFYWVAPHHINDNFRNFVFNTKA